LASTSRYRKELLSRLGLPFDTAAPDVEEAAQPSEPPRGMALRLAIAKAQAVAQLHPHALVIGSDQVAHCGGVILGKPGTHANAVQQLRFMRGQPVTFDTALALVNAATGRVQSDLVSTIVVIHPLTDAQIESYLHKEQPYDCAGSAKSEGLGIALMETLSGDDPTALIGLPLIALTRMLRAEGLDPLRASDAGP
jgi:septum formation protein